MTTHASTMREQLSAQSVIEELLRQHAGTPARNGFGRFFGYSPLGADSVSWYLGAKGEIEVGRILATLPPEWTVFHALPIGKKGADIDHLVIGPGGIVTINAKNHRGKKIWVAGQTLMVSGQKEPHIPKADSEAVRVTKLLRERMPQLPAAHPLIALVSPQSLTIKKRPERTTVLAASGLRRWLTKLPVTVAPADLLQLAAIIDDPGTWPPPTAPPTANLMGRFAALDLEVRAARVRRTGWKVASFVAMLGGVLVVGPHISAALVALMTAGLR